MLAIDMKKWQNSQERTDKINNKIEEVKTQLENSGYKNRILIISPYGSMNYSLDTPESDTDIIAVVFPSIEEITFNRSVDKTIKVLDENNNPTNEYIRIVSLGTFLNKFFKMDFQMHEIVCSHFIKFCLPSVLDNGKIGYMAERAWVLMAYDVVKFLNGILGAITSNKRALISEIAQADKMVIYYNSKTNKNLYQYVRLCEMGLRYSKEPLSRDFDAKWYPVYPQLIRYKTESVYCWEIPEILSEYELVEQEIRKNYDNFKNIENNGKNPGNEYIRGRIEKTAMDLTMCYLKEQTRHVQY